MNEEIGSYDAKTKLPEILRRVEAGESFTITNTANHSVGPVTFAGLFTRLMLLAFALIQ